MRRRSRRRFELSCCGLDETSARVFRLLPVKPGPDISAAAAVPADLSTGQVRTVLAGPARAHVVEAADAPFQPATARTPAATSNG